MRLFAWTALVVLAGVGTAWGVLEAGTRIFDRLCVRSVKWDWAGHLDEYLRVR